jgi:osmotically inducible lipoprotein OsmB
MQYSREQHLLLSVTLMTVVAMGGCDPTREDLGTATGAVVGGVAGHALFDSTLGTVGGAAAGALVGKAVGRDMDRAHTSRYHHHRERRYPDN